jgi:hypothetical protein
MSSFNSLANIIDVKLVASLRPKPGHGTGTMLALQPSTSCDSDSSWEIQKTNCSKVAEGKHAYHSERTQRLSSISKDQRKKNKLKRSYVQVENDKR